MTPQVTPLFTHVKVIYWLLKQQSHSALRIWKFLHPLCDTTEGNLLQESKVNNLLIYYTISAVCSSTNSKLFSQSKHVYVTMSNQSQLPSTFNLLSSYV